MNGAELAEARMLLRFAGQKLTENERKALTGWLAELPDTVTSKRIGITRQGVRVLRLNAIQKMRRRLSMLGIRSSNQLLSEEHCA